MNTKIVQNLIDPINIEENYSFVGYHWILGNSFFEYQNHANPSASPFFMHTITITGSKSCLSFWYIINGTDVGTLVVELEKFSRTTIQLFTMSTGEGTWIRTFYNVESDEAFKVHLQHCLYFFFQFIQGTDTEFNQFIFVFFLLLILSVLCYDATKLPRFCVACEVKRCTDFV